MGGRQGVAFEAWDRSAGGANAANPGGDGSRYPSAAATLGGMSDHNAPIIGEFRANHGKVGGFFEGAALLILHTRGVRTGNPQTVVLNHLPDGDRFVVFGTKGGAPEDPDWVRNVLADPNPTIETGTETIPVRATIVTGPERDELYARQVELRPVFGTYPSKTSRVIPAIALEPVR